MSSDRGGAGESRDIYSRKFQTTLLSVTIVRILLCVQRTMASRLTREEVLLQLDDSDVEVSSDEDSVYGGEGIVRYLPEAVGFSLGGTEEDEARNSGGSDEEENSAMEWDAEGLKQKV